MWVHFKTSSERSQVQKRTYCNIPFIWLYTMIQKHEQWLHRGSLKWDRLEKGREEISGVMQVLCYLHWVMVIYIFSNINGTLHLQWGFSGCSEVKSPPANAGDLGSIPGLGRSPGGGNANLLLYSCLGNPMDGGAWQATVHGIVRAGHDWATKIAATTNTLKN